MRMAHSISECMHRDLLQYFTRIYKGPIGIIVDGITDRVQKHQFTVILRAIENGYPVDYFYAVIELSSDQTA